MTLEQFSLLKVGGSLEVDGKQCQITHIRRVQHRHHLEIRVYLDGGTTWISSDSTSTVEAIHAK